MSLSIGAVRPQAAQNGQPKSEIDKLAQQKKDLERQLKNVEHQKSGSAKDREQKTEKLKKQIKGLEERIQQLKQDEKGGGTEKAQKQDGSPSAPRQDGFIKNGGKPQASAGVYYMEKDGTGRPTLRLSGQTPSGTSAPGSVSQEDMQALERQRQNMADIAQYL